ncbi:cation diffusion facilitator family transporter [Ursidibacter maritimus]|uniref:Cation-efflux pump FieF n=1 Tax=Ursidibacter maritimus TaxID=1331689 RepID=A0A949T2A9_9PAST|nr:cation diffusion facilitator family transporter [Ursidibacter maritimus]KAE9539305.1 divalent metal cation transporter FieF [Ursidibacter maritimus]MBV6524145.1 cation diffusion facilitator family transporter [Ursidibacter maritimus]MBV6525823.1 cation diffusion facilitator family transporter [Ursidibacter maritimus]MBV6526827.1 cation diffusion facilitator family transporter [Ursidibacter maritimus]MBV6529933.1 cation diffusion facilitator family transporter [Ursidibacter maritimus]
MEQQYAQQVKRAAMLAIVVASILILIKAFAWWKTGSMAILAAMTDSLVDLFASITNILVLRFALQPADDNHTFGHGKAESLAALVQSAFITGSAAFLLLQGIQRLTEPQFVQSSELGVVISLISIALTAMLVLYQRKVVKETGSPAIQADSLHYQTDLYMNAAIFFSMLLNINGFIYADAIFAIGIALYILYNAGVMLWEAMQSLLDQALPQEEVDRVWTIALEHPRIISIHDVKTRRAGAVRFIQLHLELDDNLPLLIAHEITDGLEQKLLNAFPMSEVIIHQEPTTIVQKERQMTAE